MPRRARLHALPAGPFASGQHRDRRAALEVRGRVDPEGRATRCSRGTPSGRSSTRSASQAGPELPLYPRHPEWSLLDALRFLAARRPEVEIQVSYIEALERWAIETLRRPPSLEQVRPRARARGAARARARAGCLARAQPHVHTRPPSPHPRDESRSDGSYRAPYGPTHLTGRGQVRGARRAVCRTRPRRQSMRAVWVCRRRRALPGA